MSKNSDTVYAHFLVVASVLLAAFSANARAQENPFAFKVRIPQTELSCEQEAASLANRFAQATGLRSVAGRCQGIVAATFDEKAYKLYSLVLNYKSQEEVYPYTAALSEGLGSSTPSSTVGAYSAYAACVGDLARQVTQFERQTRLTAVTAFCEPGVDGSNYSLRIEGFGTPKQRLFVFDTDFQGEPDALFLQGIRDLVSFLGGTIVFDKGPEIFYYNETPLRVTHDTLALFPVRDQCSAQLDYAKSMVASLGSTRVILQCLPIAASSSTVALEVVREDRGTLLTDLGIGSEKYYSFDECLTDRDRAVHEKLARGFHAVGGLCRHADDSLENYVLEVFETP